MNQVEYNWWKNGPGTLNPEYNPDWKWIREKTTSSMQKDNFYSTHTREECAAEWRRRYDIYSKAKKNQNALDNDVKS